MSYLMTYKSKLKPCPAPEDLTTQHPAIQGRQELMQLMASASFQYFKIDDEETSEDSYASQSGGLRADECRITFNPPGPPAASGGRGKVSPLAIAKIHCLDWWQPECFGGKIQITITLLKPDSSSRTVSTLVNRDYGECDRARKEASSSTVARVKKHLGLRDTTFVELLIAIITHSMTIPDFSFYEFSRGQFEEIAADKMPNYLKAIKLLHPPVFEDNTSILSEEDDSEEMIINVERCEESMSGYKYVYMRVKPSTRLSSISAKYLVIMNISSADGLAFGKYKNNNSKRFTGNPTVAEMRLVEGSTAYVWKETDLSSDSE